MANIIPFELREAVERDVQKRFPHNMLDNICIQESFDADGDKIVLVTVVLKRKPSVESVSGLTRKLWGNLSKHDFGFPILDFRTVEENARLSAAA
jgi:hypothetical protein